MVNNGCLVVTGTWLDYDFPYIGNFIIPTDSYFSEGFKPPTSFQCSETCDKLMQIDANWVSRETLAYFAYFAWIKDWHWP
jgi:hypothetical protein